MGLFLFVSYTKLHGNTFDIFGCGMSAYSLLIASQKAMAEQKTMMGEKKKKRKKKNTICFVISSSLRKTMTAQCNQFSNKAELIQVCCRCSNPEIPNVTAAAPRVGPSRADASPRRSRSEYSYIVFF